MIPIAILIIIAGGLFAANQVFVHVRINKIAARQERLEQKLNDTFAPLVDVAVDSRQLERAIDGLSPQDRRQLLKG